MYLYNRKTFLKSNNNKVWENVEESFIISNIWLFYMKEPYIKRNLHSKQYITRNRNVRQLWITESHTQEKTWESQSSVWKRNNTYLNTISSSSVVLVLPFIPQTVFWFSWIFDFPGEPTKITFTIRCFYRQYTSTVYSPSLLSLHFFSCFLVF